MGWVNALVSALAQPAIPLQHLALPGIQLLRSSGAKLGGGLKKCSHLRLLEVQHMELDDVGWVEFIETLTMRVPLPSFMSLLVAGTWTDEQHLRLKSIADSRGGACNVVKQRLLDSLELDRRGYMCRRAVAAVSCQRMPCGVC